MLKTTAVVAVLALAACSSGDLCSQTQSLSESVHSKFASCPTSSDAGGFTITFGTTTWNSCYQNACEQGLASCTASDKSVLQAELTCEQNLVNQYTGGCNPDSYLGLLFEAAACFPDGGSLSASCQGTSPTKSTCADAG